MKRVMQSPSPAHVYVQSPAPAKCLCFFVRQPYSQAGAGGEDGRLTVDLGAEGPLRGRVLQNPAAAVCRALRLLLTNLPSLGDGRGEHGRAWLREPTCHDNLAPAGVLTGKRVACTQDVFVFAVLFTTHDPPSVVWQSPAPAMFYTSARASRRISMGYFVALL